jgi:hypothetical protein
MLRIAITMAVVVLAGFQSAVSAQPAASEYFPSQPGNRWTYRIVGQDDRLVVVSTFTEPIGGYSCFRLESRLRSQFIASAHFSVRKDGVYQMRSDGYNLDPPLPICKFPPTDKETWKVDFKLGEKKATIAYECSFEEVTVPTGKYKALVIHSETPEGTGKLLNTCWYAPKVGLVKQVVDDGDKIVLELEKFDRFSLKK